MKNQNTFEEDPYPIGLKILFIGLADSSHTHSWIDLLKDSEFNVRFFATPESGLPPENWKIRTYIPFPDLPVGLNPDIRKTLYPTPEIIAKANQLNLEIIAQANQLNLEKEQQRHQEERRNPILRINRLFNEGFDINPGADKPLHTLLAGILLIGFSIISVFWPKKRQNKAATISTNLCINPPTESSTCELALSPEIRVQSVNGWLEEIITDWQPDIIHTLGMNDFQGGDFFWQVRESSPSIRQIGKWVLQLRGGSDLTLRKSDPDWKHRLKCIMDDCSSIISDNYSNIEFAAQLNVTRDKFAPITPVPGTGGIQITSFPDISLYPPSIRRIILWPKAYESIYSKSIPVLEAIQLCWKDIQPCEIFMTAVDAETRAWFYLLPEEIKEHCHLFDRIPHKELLNLMSQARILLIPSLIDGVPNTLYEAMAAGAFPIVSPLPTITPIVNEPDNVLFARNLYPNEIAAALVRAMNNNNLVESAAEKNLERVREIACRETIKKKVIDYYQTLTGSKKNG